MHLEILVEDISGKRALEALLPTILGVSHTFQVHSYRGIGHVPKNMKDAADPGKRILLENLPKLLKGFGRTFHGYGPDYQAAVVVICDLDDRDPRTFMADLVDMLDRCNPRPTAKFYFAIEEGEAWLLGDLDAVRTAYPNADRAVLKGYVNDSICGTWELFADAVYPGGRAALIQKGWQAVGAEKWRWAGEVTPHMNVEINASPSFCLFRDSIRRLAFQGEEKG